MSAQLNPTRYEAGGSAISIGAIADAVYKAHVQVRSAWNLIVANGGSGRKDAHSALLSLHRVMIEVGKSESNLRRKTSAAASSTAAGKDGVFGSPARVYVRPPAIHQGGHPQSGSGRQAPPARLTSVEMLMLQLQPPPANPKQMAKFVQWSIWTQHQIRMLRCVQFSSVEFSLVAVEC